MTQAPLTFNCHLHKCIFICQSFDRGHAFFLILEFQVVFLVQSTPEIYLPELTVSISVSLVQSQDLRYIGKAV